MITRETMLTLESWRGAQEIDLIDTNLIDITHDEHLNTTSLNFKKGMSKPSRTRDGLIVPVVLREIEGGRYELLFGVKQLVVFKIMNGQTIPAVITDYNREELISRLNSNKTFVGYPMSKIQITEAFDRSRPSPKKIKNKRKLIENGSTPNILIDESGVLIDGYITYSILKEDGVKRTDVSII